MEYLSKHNRVWQNVETGALHGRKISLKEGERLTDYRQVPAQNEQKETAKSWGNTAKKGGNISERNDTQ